MFEDRRPRHEDLQRELASARSALAAKLPPEFFGFGEQANRHTRPELGDVLLSTRFKFKDLVGALNTYDFVRDTLSRIGWTPEKTAHNLPLVPKAFPHDPTHQATNIRRRVVEACLDLRVNCSASG